MVGNHIKESLAEEIEARFNIPKQEALEKYVVETRYRAEPKRVRYH
jgi:hypothetical protein